LSDDAAAGGGAGKDEGHLYKVEEGMVAATRRNVAYHIGPGGQLGPPPV